MFCLFFRPDGSGELQLPRLFDAAAAAATGSEERGPNALTGPRAKGRRNTKLAMAKSREQPRRQSSKTGVDRLTLFSPKGDVGALSIEQLIEVLQHRGEAWPEDADKAGLQALVRQTTTTAAQEKSVATSAKKLLILDMNGLLVDRPSFISRQRQKGNNPDLVTRPFLDDFLQLAITELQFDVAVWTAGRNNLVYVPFAVVVIDSCARPFLAHAASVHRRPSMSDTASNAAVNLNTLCW